MPLPTCEYIILVRLDFLFWYGQPFEMVGVEERGKTQGRGEGMDEEDA